MPYCNYEAHLPPVEMNQARNTGYQASSTSHPTQQTLYALFTSVTAALRRREGGCSYRITCHGRSWQREWTAETLQTIARRKGFEIWVHRRGRGPHTERRLGELKKRLTRRGGQGRTWTAQLVNLEKGEEEDLPLQDFHLNVKKLQQTPLPFVIKLQGQPTAKGREICKNGVNSSGRRVTPPPSTDGSSLPTTPCSPHGPYLPFARQQEPT